MGTETETDLLPEVREFLEKHGYMNHDDVFRFVTNRRPTLTSSEISREVDEIVEVLLSDPAYRITDEGLIMKIKPGPGGVHLN